MPAVLQSGYSKAAALDAANDRAAEYSTQLEAATAALQELRNAAQSPPPEEETMAVDGDKEFVDAVKNPGEFAAAVETALAQATPDELRDIVAQFARLGVDVGPNGFGAEVISATQQSVTAQTPKSNAAGTAGTNTELEKTAEKPKKKTLTTRLENGVKATPMGETPLGEVAAVAAADSRLTMLFRTDSLGRGRNGLH